MKGKVEKVTKQAYVDTNGNEYYSVTIDGKQGNYACKGGKDPYFVVGQEQEYEEEVKPDKNGTPRTKFKKPFSGNGFGGGKKQTLPLNEAKRMCKSNAISAMVQTNQLLVDVPVENRVLIKSSDLAAIVGFTLGTISGEIDKWGEEHNNLISRLASMSNAAQDVKCYDVNSVQDLITRATNFYKYVVS